MMEAARTYETSVDNYFIRQDIPEDKSVIQCLIPVICQLPAVHRSLVDPLKGMRVLLQCKFPEAEVMFVTTQRANTILSKKEMNKL
jgi:hypothetical protein